MAHLQKEWQTGERLGARSINGLGAKISPTQGNTIVFPHNPIERAPTLAPVCHSFCKCAIGKVPSSGTVNRAILIWTVETLGRDNERRISILSWKRLKAVPF